MRELVFPWDVCVAILLVPHKILKMLQYYVSLGLIFSFLSIKGQLKKTGLHGKNSVLFQISANQIILTCFATQGCFLKTEIVVCFVHYFQLFILLGLRLRNHNWWIMTFCQ